MEIHWKQLAEASARPETSQEYFLRPLDVRATLRTCLPGKEARESARNKLLGLTRINNCVRSGNETAAVMDDGACLFGKVRHRTEPLVDPDQPLPLGRARRGVDAGQRNGQPREQDRSMSDSTTNKIQPAFSYFKHDEEIGIIGRGATVEQAFESAAAGMFAIMAGSGNAAVTKHIEVAFVEPQIERALVTWLSRLLVEARAQDAALFTFHLERGPNYQWHGKAEGCSTRHAHDLGVEVKRVASNEASVHTNSGGAEARCVVDV